jgi:hypothetical protein
MADFGHSQRRQNDRNLADDFLDTLYSFSSRKLAPLGINEHAGV